MRRRYDAIQASSLSRQQAEVVTRSRVNKTVERAAREIKDTDEFIEHIAAIAARYRREHNAESGPRASAVRQSIRQFSRHARILADWLGAAHARRRPGVEADALEQIGVAMQGGSNSVRSDSNELMQWLTRAQQASEQCLERSKGSRKEQRRAPSVAAEALRATFEHHQLKMPSAGSSSKPSSAVRLLTVIAKSVGDAELDVEDARAAWLGSSSSAKRGAGAR